MAIIKARRVLRSFENVFVVIVLFLSTGALLPFLNGPSSSVDALLQSSPTTQLVWLGVYAIVALLAATRWRQVVYVATRDKLLLLLLGIAVVSVLWSVAPDLTLRRSVGLVGTTLFGAYLATRYSRGELLRLLAWALGIAVLLSIVFALALPAYGIVNDPRGAAWRGIYFHKNTLGRTMALSAVLFLFLALGDRTRHWIVWVWLGLSVVVLFLAQSIASLGFFLAVAAMWPLYRVLRWRRTLAASFYIFALLACATATVLLGANAESILSVLNRDPTLSGRTELWSILLGIIGQQPWLGYGYMAFWEGWSGPSGRVWLWSLSTGHGFLGAADNGILDLWLQLGLLGLSVFACGFIRAISRAVRWALVTKTAEGLWPLAILTLMLGYSFFESAILTYNSILWMLYVEASLSVGVLASVSSLGGDRAALDNGVTNYGRPKAKGGWKERYS